MFSAAASPERVVSQMPALLTADLLMRTPASDLAEALMRLTKAERLVLSLTYFHELTVVDVATVMNLRSQDVLAIHADAINRLSDLLQKAE